VIHLGFAPLLLAGLSTDIDPRWFLAVFVLLLLVFWGTLGTRVPLYLSGRDAVAAVEDLLPERRPLSVLDIGCGTAAMLAPLARRRPDCSFTGIETAPLPWLIARIRAIGLTNLHIIRGDFFRHDWSSHDVVYAFLSPYPMPQVECKAQAELEPDALLISKDFAASGLTPSHVVELPSGGVLYCYRPGAVSARPD
jgi:SAM-dependent methyltransferase